VCPCLTSERYDRTAQDEDLGILGRPGRFSSGGCRPGG